MGGPLRLKNQHENEVIRILTMMLRKVCPGPVAGSAKVTELGDGKRRKGSQMPVQSDKKT